MIVKREPGSNVTDTYLILFGLPDRDEATCRAEVAHFAALAGIKPEDYTIERRPRDTPVGFDVLLMVREGVEYDEHRWRRTWESDEWRARKETP